LNTKNIASISGVMFIVIALILSGVQILEVYNIYGVSANKRYFYGAVAIIEIIGIILSVRVKMKKGTPKQTTS